MRRCLESGGSGNAFSSMDSSMSQVRHPQLRDSVNGQKASVATLFEQGISICLSKKIDAIHHSLCMYDKQ